MKFLGKAAAMVSAAAVAVSMSAAPALAADWQAPTFTPPTSKSSTIQNNERLLSAIGAHGSAVVGEYVGLSEQINQSYATPGNGVNTTNYTTNPFFGIYGSSANENPDPYVANLFYKWYLKANNMTDTVTTDYMYNYQFDGYSGSCITSDNKSQKNGTSIALSGRPDVIVTQAKSADADDSTFAANKANWTKQIQAINSLKSGDKYYQPANDHYVGDENYNPQFAGYIEVTTPGFIQSVYNAADAADAAREYSWNGTKQQAKVGLRYGDTAPQQVAQDYERYTKGTDLYILSKIADGTLKKKTVAYVVSMDGEGKDAHFTIQGNLDPLTSGESSGHIYEPLNATCDNLANVEDPSLPKTASKPGQDTQITVDVATLAKADVIILANADNMKYNYGGAETYTGPQKGEIASLDDAEKDADGNTVENGENSSRHYGDLATGVFKNNFYGPSEKNTTLVSGIQDALKDAGYTEQANRSILSCMMENGSNCDGGSVDSMALHGVINGFAYPEIMNPLEQFGYFINTMEHIKTDEVPTMVQKLAQDMSLPTLSNGKALSINSINGYDQSTASKIREQENRGFAYYEQHKDEIDANYPQLTPSLRYKMVAVTGIETGDTAVVSGITYKATGTSTVTVSKGANKKSVTVPAKVKINKRTYNVTGIAAKAFKSSKATKLTVKSTKLTKKSVKNSLKGSKVKTVKVPKAKKAAYKKIFTKANAGKKVTVK